MSECEIQISHIKSQRSNYDSAAWRSKVDEEVSRLEWFIEKLKNLDEETVKRVDLIDFCKWAATNPDTPEEIMTAEELFAYWEKSIKSSEA